MKCLLIASESAEVLFHWSDREYRQNIQEKYGVSQEEGEGVRRRRTINPSYLIASSEGLKLLICFISNSSFQLPAFEDILSTLFAPIIISCSTLEDSYTSFTTENNHIYVLHQVISAHPPSFMTQLHKKMISALPCELPCSDSGILDSRKHLCRSDVNECLSFSEVSCEWS